VVALAGIGLTAVTSLIVLRHSLLANDAGPVLGELQGRVADRLKIELAGTIGTQGWRARLAWSAFPATIALGLALLVSIGALLYAVIR
jgi:hypothetical protein